ncbi:hypothetical protein BS17DRAFT_339600 [Gyrodon lividus]|nr:hypothetical protein BS17DRAFT_339600 [Gyrodon lividus]
MTPAPSTETDGESSRAESHQPQPANKVPPNKLTKEGSAFLTNYARTISSYPRRSEKFDILASVQAIPGNEYFTFEKLTSWFSRHRNPAHAPPYVRTGREGLGARAASADEEMAPGGRMLVDDDSILFPKLTPMHLRQLRVLYKKRPDPAQGIITFWANRLNADRAEVLAWIQYQQEKAKEEAMAGTLESPDLPLRQFTSTSASVSPRLPKLARPHLPTPAKSVSPETRMPSLPPIAVKVEESGLPTTSFGLPTSLLQRPSSSSFMPFPKYEGCSMLAGLPPLRRDSHTMHPPQPEHQAESQSLLRPRPNALLAASLRNSSQLGQDVDEKPPTTAEDFASRFAPVEKQINVFMQKLEGGQLARLGWDLSLSQNIDELWR